jgi:hypothetical protein
MVDDGRRAADLSVAGGTADLHGVRLLDGDEEV